MKKRFSILNTKILLPIMASGIIMAGCHVNDTNAPSTIGGDTTMMHSDTEMIDKNNDPCAGHKYDGRHNE